MMKKVSWLIGGLVVLGLIAFVTPAPHSYTPPTQEAALPAGVTGGLVATTSTTITLAEVAKHNSASSCYTVVGGQVYDLTQWIGQHPGGEEAILSLCGSDGTAAFEAQHGSSRKAQRVLTSYLIGPLQK